jgi:group I intron endonuclease
MACGIYAITNEMAKRTYVGGSFDIGKRWLAHKSYLRHGKHRVKAMQEDYDSSGKDWMTYELLEECHSTQLRTREIWWINALNPKYNRHKPPIGTEVIEKDRRMCECCEKSVARKGERFCTTCRKVTRAKCQMAMQGA